MYKERVNLNVQKQPPEVFCEKGVLRNFAKFTGKHLCLSLFLNEVEGLRPAALFRKRLGHSCFPANFVEFLKTPFLTKHLRWLLLNVSRTVQKKLGLSYSSNLLATMIMQRRKFLTFSSAEMALN